MIMPKDKEGLISRAGCLPYNPKLTNRARELRKNMTFTEKLIWYNYARTCKYVIQRQKVINHFIVDFYCSKALLVIEIDGGHHFLVDNLEYDQSRDTILEGYGIKVLRFTNEAVLNDFDKVTQTIDFEIEKRINNSIKST